MERCSNEFGMEDQQWMAMLNLRSQNYDDFGTSPERSPRAISLLNGIVEGEGFEENEGVEVCGLTGGGVRTRIPTEKGREFELNRLKDNRTSALSSLTKRMNAMRPLLLSLKNVERVKVELLGLNTLFTRLQEANEQYVNALRDDDQIRSAHEWFDVHDRNVFKFKQIVIEFLNEAKKQDVDDIVSHSSQHSKRSVSSSSSAKSKLLEAKAKAAALEVKAAFLKEKQALRIASEELELRQEMAQAKVEEKIYQQFEKEQVTEEKNDCFNGMKVKFTSTPISSEAIPCNQVTSPLTFTSVDAPVTTQAPAVVNSVDTVFVVAPSNIPTTSVTSATSNLHLSARPFVPVNVSSKSEEPAISPVVKPSYQQQGPGIYGKDSSCVVNNSVYQEFITVQRKQAELSEMIVTQQARSLLPSHKPPVFSGDVMTYPAFITAFETLIESKVEDSVERLYYLDQYTSGKAKELIKGCVQLGTGSSYEEARQLLKKHFGDPYKIATAYISKISNWPYIKPNDGAALQDFSIILQQAKNATTGLAHLNDLNTSNVLRQLWERLPRHLRAKWTEKVNKIKCTKERMANFNDFCQFVSEQADLATDPIFSEEMITRPKNVNERPQKHREQRYNRERGSSFATDVSNTGGDTKTRKSNPCTSCTLCSKPHDLDECAEYLRKSLKERRNFVKEKGLCFGCFSSQHIARFCKSRKSCRICEKRHPTSLHDHNWEREERKLVGEAVKGEESNICRKKDEGESINVCNTVCNVTEAGDVPINMGIVPIWLYHQKNPDKKIMVYALLDSASGGTFVKENSLRKLGVEGTDTKLLLTTMHGTQEVDTKAVSGLVAVNFVENNLSLNIPRAYVRHNIPAERNEIPRPEMVAQWPHLRSIAKEMPPYMEDVEIGLLIGLNCPSAVKPRDVVHGKENEPYAVRSLLGWHINGPVKCEESDRMQCHRIQICKSCTNEEAIGYIVTKRGVKEQITPHLVGRMFELDFSEREKGVGLSQEDREFLKKVEKGIHHRRDLHYEMPLPFREENLQLPNNRPQAVQRLHCLKRRLQSDDKYCADYVNFMTDIINKGYAHKVDAEKLVTQRGKVWYLPHHGIYHPQKPGSIRVVFDCSARYQGESLNDHLLQGPDLTSKLIGVLTRLREERVAIMADIEKMFYQVKVKKEDQDYLRFLWWSEGDLTREPEEYCMTVHLFGAGSSPGCSNFALKRTADDGKSEFGIKAAETLRRNFYVDDLLKSVPTEEDAVELVQDVKAMCAKGGFNLTKFVSNSRKVMMSVLPEDKVKEIKDLDLGQDKLPVERALGAQWCIESDAFKFRIELKDKPCTRRGILSTVSSVYDPLGFIAPVILVGKQILQEICHKCSWDEPVEEDIFARWEKWRSQLFLLDRLSIQRSFKPPNFGSIVSVQLHNMSDASETGYGQCSYLRFVDDSGTIHCSFVMGKARVAPKKVISIPRLELAAAAVSVKIADVLKDELDYQKIEEFYWTDSKVVLGFINNESRRFHVYVANRVQLIRDHTLPTQWRHVASTVNPADEGSRGMNAREFIQKSKWISGPEFLWQSEDQWPKQGSCKNEIDPNSPELKKVTANTTVVEEKKDILATFERFSSWQKLKKVIALCMMFYKQLLKAWENTANNQNLTKETQRINSPGGTPITVKDLKEAEEAIIKLVQADAFEKDLKVLKDLEADRKDKCRQKDKAKKVALKRTGSLQSLDPFLDTSGLLRVGGRIKKANLTDNLKTPIILPKGGHVTKLIIRYAHEKVHHSGRGVTLNELRTNGYWIINGNAATQTYISKCVRCRYLRGSTGEQKMASLPESRLQPAPPFTYSAVDYFGPFYVKEGRKQVKRYGALFTCMASRAIHIEVAHSMETDSFLQALRRFISRRGPVKELRSDQGTNFIGAENELKKALQEMDDHRLKAELLKHDIDWVRNPAAASNFGGVWERQIRSVRSVLVALMKEHGHSLDDESLRTLMCEAEAVVNGRPLTVDTLSDPLSLLPLTPNALLTGKSKLILPPPGKFQREDVYCKRRWRRVQHIANQFWSRWSKEYLQSLQVRHKWTRSRRNLAVGDIVLLRDGNASRNEWPLARVFSTREDEEGHVRSVTVRTSSGSRLDRPINKLILILESEEGPGIPDGEPQ